MRIGINGLGRIGRCLLRAWLKQNNPQVEIAVINDLADINTLAYLMRYDSIHGALSYPINVDADRLQLAHHQINVTQIKDPAAIPWAAHNVDLVIEATGAFTDAQQARVHLNARGVKKVIITAPAKKPDITLAIGVNNSMYDPTQHHVISSASCTTHCLANVAQVLLDSFGIRRGLMTTIHSYTNDQRLLDLPHKDLRRARAAGLSMIPTTTGAAKALGEVLPELKGKLDGYALRVPTPNVSLVDLTVELEKNAALMEINQAFVDVSCVKPHILGTTDEPVVSIDFNGDTRSAIVDLSSMQSSQGLWKILAWYDNEMGYATRLLELANWIGHSA